MKQQLFRETILGGALALSLGVVACTPVSDEDFSLTAEGADIFTSCAGEDCPVTRADAPYLTDRFIEAEEISSSRPAGVQATSVKDKTAPKFAAAPVSEPAPQPVAKAPEPKPAPAPVPAEIVATHEELIPITQRIIAESAPQDAMRTVKTTITETNTTSQIDAATGRRVESRIEVKEKLNIETATLSSRVAYGEQVHDWDAPAGETLRSLLMQWGEMSGWTVVWKMDRDYHLEAGVVFRGTFTDVASAIIRTYARATPAPIGTFYKGNRVLVVNTQEDENAH